MFMFIDAVCVPLCVSESTSAYVLTSLSVLNNEGG